MFTGYLSSLITSMMLFGASDVVHQKVLGNGLRVVTLEDRSCPVVAVQVWYHVGSKDEDPERQGFAHMFEHMMFRGTDRLGPEAHFEFIRSTGGDCNAYTSFDQTVYVQTVPKDQLPMVLWLEAERMSSLKVDQAGFETERAVVEEERRLGLNQPYGTVLEKLLARIFQKHPYRWSTIGNIDHLRRATAEELLRFWEKFYVPNNATLVVVGDVDHALVEAEAEKAFGWIPRCADPPRIEEREPLFEKPLVIELEESSGPVPVVAVGYRTVGMAHPDALPLEMLTTILGGGESSRLYRTIVDDAEAAVMAMGGAMSMEHDGFAGAAAILMPFSNMEKPLSMIEAELERVKKEGITAAELEKVRTQFLRKLVDSSRTVESKAQRVGTAAVFEGGVETIDARAKRIEGMTKDELLRVASVYFVPERKVIVKIKPTVGGMLKSLFGNKGKAEGEDEAPKKEIASDAPAPKRMGPKAEAKRPEGYPEQAPVAAPEPAKVDFAAQRRTLPNGLEVVVVENRELPAVSLTLGFKSGSATDAEETNGAASMAMALLTKGNATKSAAEIAEFLESNAIDLSASSSMDSCTIRGSALKDNAFKLFSILADTVKSPTFSEAEFKKLKRQAATGKKIGERQPAALADRAFARGLYGEHPYAREEGGTSAELEKLGLDAAVSWWKTYARPDHAVLYVAGDVAAEKAFAAAESMFSDWRSDGSPPGAKFAVAPATGETHIVLVDVPGAIQSQIRVGHLGFEREDAAYPTARVLSQVFGGAFNSRLNQVIRVEKGLTYGASGGFRSQRYAGQFYVSTFSKTKTTVEAVRAILGEVNRIRDEAPTPKELAQAKSYLVGSFAGDHETPESIVGELWSLALDGLEPKFFDDYLAAVVKTTAEDVQKLAKERIHPDRLLIVVVGDAAKIEAGLKEVAPVTIVDELGKPKQLKPKVDSAK